MILRDTRSFLLLAAAFAALVVPACSSSGSANTDDPLGAAGDYSSGSGGTTTSPTGTAGDLQGSSGNTGTAGSTSVTSGAGGSAGSSVGGAGGGAGAGVGGAAGSTPAGDGGAIGNCTYTLPAGAALCSCPSITGRQNCTATKAQPILDSAEWQDSNDGQGVRPEGANLGTFGGWWGHWADAGSAGCVQSIPMPPSSQNWQKQFANPLVPQANPFNPASKAAMSLKGAGCTGTTAFWIGPGPDPACDNLSVFQGFTFTAMADANVDITAFVTQKDDPSQSKHAIVFHATNAWQKFSVPFCALGNAGTFNAANVAEVGFSVTTAAFQIWIDDIVFQ
jgi:hypothetical protein